jgi:hypothetical protein
MIANGGTIICSGKCHKINLTMGKYVMNSSMIVIPMCGVDVVLGVQWLQSLGTVAFNFQELFMKFSLERKEFELRGIIGKPSKMLSSNGMTKLLKKGHQGVIVQLCSLDVQTSKPSIPLNLQGIIDKHSKVFEDIPKGLPPTNDHDHGIHLIPRSVPPNIRPYRYAYAQKSESLEENGWWNLPRPVPIQLGHGVKTNEQEGLNEMKGIVRLLTIRSNRMDLPQYAEN